MRKIFTVILCLAYSLSYAQEDHMNNGINIEPFCTTNCVFTIIEHAVVYEEEGVEHWKMYNGELAIKSHGVYIATGDLAISGHELAGILNFKILFYDKDHNLVKEVETGEFEFYSEAEHAEPFVFTGQLDESEASRVSNLYFEVVSSKIVPYYEIDSDCYVACKNHQLNEALKTFKKSK